MTKTDQHFRARVCTAVQRIDSTLTPDVNAPFYSGYLDVALNVYVAAANAPIGYLPANEVARLNSGHDANLRSAKFGPSQLDGDVAVYLTAPQPAQTEEMIRFCPECGCLGDIPAGYEACCPDSSHARVVPKRFAELCRETFKLCVSQLVQPATASQPAQTQVALTDDARDAARYRWLRRQHWNEAEMFVVAGSKSQVRVGTDCPSLVRLDDAIDAALAAAQPASGGDR
ncbi:hypothetical protein PQR71_12850 [Paraburkholderia fungorum]|uniref:hypothetical protein n=1 Tax=Paraburkholderia fungorum TaxID=134537 RepID=UPI0038BE0D05